MGLSYANPARSVRFFIQALYSVVTRVVITQLTVLLHLFRELCGLTIWFNSSYILTYVVTASGSAWVGGLTLLRSDRLQATMQAQNGINTYSQGDLQRMIRQVSDLYTQTAEATAKELEDASSLSEAGGENFKVCLSHLWQLDSDF